MHFPSSLSDGTVQPKLDLSRDPPRNRRVSKESGHSHSPRKIIEESGIQLAQSSQVNTSPREVTFENRVHPHRKSSEPSHSPTKNIDETESPQVQGSLRRSSSRNVPVDHRHHLPRKSSDHSRSPTESASQIAHNSLKLSPRNLSVETGHSSPRRKSPRSDLSNSDTSGDSSERIKTFRMSHGRNNHHAVEPAMVQPSIHIGEVKSLSDQNFRKLNLDSITNNTRHCHAKIRRDIIADLLQLQNSFDTLTDSIITHEHSYDVNFEHPNSLFLLAITQGIFEYMNEKGKFCTLEDLVRLVAEKVDDHFPNRFPIIKNILDEHRRKQALQDKKLNAKIANRDLDLATTHSMLMDKVISEMKDSAKQFIDLLLNIEPLTNKDGSINDKEIPNLPLITALNIYKNYVTSEEFFDILALLIKNPNVSYVLKMRYLILCRMWLDYKMCNTDKNLTHFTYAYDEIFKACEYTYEVDFSPESLAVRNLCDELKIDFNEAVVARKSIYANCIFNKEQIKVYDYLNKYLLSSENIEPSEFIEKIAADLNIEAALIIKTINPANFLSSKKMEEHREISNYTNNLSQFVKNYALGISSVNIKSRFITLFVSLIFNLVKKRDFLNALAIYSPINSLFSDILKKSDNKQESKHHVERIELSSVTYQHFENICKLFNPSGLFKNVSAEIVKCQWQRIFYIPNLLTIATFAEYEMATLEKEKKLTDNEKKFRFHESMLIEQIYEMGIKDVKFHIRKSFENLILNTDIGYQINRTEHGL